MHDASRATGEIEGEDYYFLSKEEFARRLNAGEFLEQATVHGHQYGTLRSTVLNHLNQGVDVLLDIDIQGAASIRAYPIRRSSTRWRMSSSCRAASMNSPSPHQARHRDPGADRDPAPQRRWRNEKLATVPVLDHQRLSGRGPAKNSARSCARSDTLAGGCFSIYERITNHRRRRHGIHRGVQGGRSRQQTGEARPRDPRRDDGGGEGIHHTTHAPNASRNPVLGSVFDAKEGWRPGHIDLADRANLLLIAPATANTIAALAHGLANDALTEIALAVEAPVLIAPAMNGKMWKHPATQANVALLQSRDVHFIGPEAGMLACGYEGLGRLWNVDEIVERAMQLLG